MFKKAPQCYCIQVVEWWVLRQHMYWSTGPSLPPLPAPAACGAFVVRSVDTEMVCTATQTEHVWVMRYEVHLKQTLQTKRKEAMWPARINLLSPSCKCLIECENTTWHVRNCVCRASGGRQTVMTLCPVAMTDLRQSQSGQLTYSTLLLCL